MNITQMRGFLKNRYPNSKMWCKKVDKMPDEQVIAIYMNPYIVMPKNLGRTQQEQAFNTYLSATKHIENPNRYSLTSAFRTEQSPSEDYTICPHCGAHLDIDEQCDCYKINLKED